MSYQSTRASVGLAVANTKSTLREEILRAMSWSNKSRTLIRQEGKLKVPGTFVSAATPTIWATIVKEEETERKEITRYKKIMLSDECDPPQSPLMEYMRDNLLCILYPILELMLFEAIETNSLQKQESVFNGIDYIAENLWNSNPLYPKRKLDNLMIHDMDWAKEYLAKHPRPYFPLSWIFSKHMAATKIQSYVRAYWVRRREDVQEMRQFWKALKHERNKN